MEIGQEARIVQINFSAAFDRVNHQGIPIKLYSVGVGGSVLYVLTQFISNRLQFVVVDGCRSKLVNLLSGVPQGSVLSPQLFLLYTAELFPIVEKKLDGCGDDFTKVVVVSSPAEKVPVTVYMNSDLNRVSGGVTSGE